MQQRKYKVLKVPYDFYKELIKLKITAPMEIRQYSLTEFFEYLYKNGFIKIEKIDNEIAKIVKTLKIK